MIEAVAKWLGRVLTQPLEELNRWQKAVRFAYDLGRFGARQLQQDRAQQMAAALAFRTIFGLLPVLVVATVLVKALGMQEQYLVPLGRLFEFLQLDQVRIIPPSGMGDSLTTLGSWLTDRVREAERVNVTAIGWVGVAVTIYAAIGLMVTVENCFNIIYRAPYGRTWTSRVPVYWFLLTLSPLVLVFSAYVDGRFQSLMRELQVRGWLSSAVGLFWSIFAIWIVMFAVYALFPNTRVRLRPAMAGALVAAILLEVGKRTMGMYLQNALSLSQLYGSLGLIPLFMFWVYLMWLAVLFGLQVSSTLQHLHGRQLAELESRRCEAMFIEPAVITVLMKRVAARFAMGRETSVDDLAETTGLTPQVVERIVDPLAAGPWLHRVAGRDGVVALSQPPERILIRELLEFAFGLAGRLNGGDSASTLMRRLRQVQQELTEDMHLGTLLQADVLPPESQTARSIIGRLQDPGLNGRARPAGAREMTSEMGLNQGEIES